MTRIALLSSEPLRSRMAGIGIRYLEFARRLPRPGLEIVVLAAGDAARALELDLGDATLRPYEHTRLAAALSDCDGVVVQGQLANDVVLQVPKIPVAIDLYDPWLVENLHYHAALGLDPYRNDHATWVLQMSRGDFFLCSSREQRQFYLGFLTAVGRVNPERVGWDPELAGLIAVVPFGVPDEPPEYHPLLDPTAADERRLLFGGLYDWYDPWPVLEALVASKRPNWKLLFVRNPYAEETPQRCFAQVEAWCRERGLWERQVLALDWIPSERRYDLLRDVDALVATHRPGIETELSLRTRFLDALAVGCPVLTTDGGTVSRLLREERAGWVVPAGDAEAVAAALVEILDGDETPTRVAAGRSVAERFHWQRVLEPLVGFCREPKSDPTKERFAFRPATMAPSDSLPFRVRRRLGILKRRLYSFAAARQKERAG